MNQTILLELNEVNFELVSKYAANGFLPTLARLIDEHGISNTESEQKYEELEPWIQWVSAHTGKRLAEHRVFRLGDIVNTDIEQIWERLEKRGVSVGAVSPMNAKNRTTRASFFMPDPWTATSVTGSFVLKKMYAAVSQAVNDNAQSRLSMSSLFWLLVGTAVYASPRQYHTYCRFIAKAARKPWYKAIFLDLLLSDLFIKLTRKHKPDFASLFVNAAAHIQHHYMFNSSVYEGNLKNPDWYIDQDEDPILDVYKVYDGLVHAVECQLPEARLMIATGLHQDAHPEVTYYWRLKNHAAFFSKIGLSFENVLPRMSRDFVIQCQHSDEAKAAQSMLESAVAADGEALFEVDNRGNDLFVVLCYPHEIGRDFRYMIGDREFVDFKDDVAFVAIKNGRHNGIGYFLDAGAPKGSHPPVFPLTQLFEKCDALYSTR